MKVSTKPKIQLRTTQLSMANLMATHNQLESSCKLPDLSLSKTSMQHCLQASSCTVGQDRYQHISRLKQNSMPFKGHQQGSTRTKHRSFFESRLQEPEPKQMYEILEHSNSALRHQSKNYLSQRKYMEMEKDFVAKRHQEIQQEIREANTKIVALQGNGNRLQEYIQQQERKNKIMQRENDVLSKQIQNFKVLSLKVQMLERLNSDNEHQMDQQETYWFRDKETLLQEVRTELRHQAGQINSN